MRGVVEVREKSAAIIELEDRSKGIIRRHQLFVGTAETDARANARATNRWNLARGAGERGCECIASVFGEPLLETKQDDVSNHRGRLLGGRASRVCGVEGFAGGR